MTTQAEVIEAFARFNDQPASASNMRIREIDNSRDALCGGRNAREMVLAVREPLRQVTVFRGRPDRWQVRMRYVNARQQVHHVRRVTYRLAEQFEERDDETEIDYTRVHETPPDPEEHGCLP